MRQAVSQMQNLGHPEVHDLAGAVAAAYENSLHWHQNRPVCQIVLAAAAHGVFPENLRILGTIAQDSAGCAAEHIAEAAHYLVASDAFVQGILQGPVAAGPAAAGRLAGKPAAERSLPAFVPVLRTVVVAEQEPAAQVLENWAAAAAAGREIAGFLSKCCPSMACSCSFFPNWLSTLRRFQAWVDEILRTVEDAVTLKRDSRSDRGIWKVTTAGIPSDLGIFGYASFSPMQLVALVVPVQVLIAGDAVGSVGRSSIRSVTLMVSAQVLTVGSDVGYASLPFLALVV